jgi:GABA permease
VIQSGARRQENSSRIPPDEASEARGRLSHALKPRHVAMISFGGVIGAGLFVGSSAAIATTGPAVVFSYLLAGSIALMVMRMLGEMAVARPGQGSFIEYVRLGLGHWAGFVSGWLYWYFWTIVVGAESIAGTTILQNWIHSSAWLINLVLIALVTLANLLSVRAYGEFQFWFASVKVTAIVVFAFVAVGHITGSPGAATVTFSNLFNHGGFMPHGLASVLAAVPVVIFSITGTEVATVAAAESEAPADNVARAARLVVMRVITFYVASIFLIVCVLPWTSIVPGSSPFVLALSAMGIPGAGTVMLIIVLMAVLSCMNSGLYVTSRILFELAAHGDAPKRLVRIGRRGVPIRAILIGSVVSYAVAFSSVEAPGVVFAFLLSASGTLVLFIYLLVGAAQLAMRRADEGRGVRLKFRVWCHPWLSYGTLVAVAMIIAALGNVPATRSQLIASSVALVVAFVIYMLRRRV